MAGPSRSKVTLLPITSGEPVIAVSTATCCFSKFAVARRPALNPVQNGLALPGRQRTPVPVYRGLPGLGECGVDQPVGIWRRGAAGKGQAKQ